MLKIWYALDLPERGSDDPVQFRLSGWQVASLYTITSISLTPFGFSDLFTVAGRHIWWASLVQAMVTLLSAAGVLLLLGRFPNMNLRQILLEVTGSRVIAGGYLIMLVICVFAWGPVGNQRTILRLVEASTLPLMSPLLLSAILMLAATYASYFGPEVIARSLETWSFVLIPMLVLISLVPWPGLLFGRLLPLTLPPLDTLTHPTFWAFAVGLRGFAVLLLLAGSLPAPSSLRPAVIGATAGSIIITSLLVVSPVAQFSPELIRLMQFPVLEALDTINASVIGVHSFLSISLIVWYFVSFTAITTTVFACSDLLRQALGSLNHRWFLIPVFVGGLLTGAFPVTVEVEIFLGYWWSSLGLAVVTGLGPWLLWIIAAIRGLSDSGTGS